MSAQTTDTAFASLNPPFVLAALAADGSTRKTQTFVARGPALEWIQSWTGRAAAIECNGVRVFGANRDGSVNGNGATPAPDSERTATQDVGPLLDASPRNDAAALLACIHGDSSTLLACIDPNGGAPKCEAITLPHDAPALDAWRAQREQRKENAYFHVAVTRARLSRKAKKEDVDHVSALWVDIDPAKVERQPGETHADFATRAAAQLASEQARIIAAVTTNLPAGVPPPSAVVRSGNGVNAYWKLRECFAADAGDSRGLDDFEALNRRLARVFGADDCWNVDRILRLPGTTNYPSPTKLKSGRTAQRAELVELHPELVYGLEDFASLPALEEPPPARNASKTCKSIRGAANTAPKSEDTNGAGIPTLPEAEARQHMQEIADNYDAIASGYGNDHSRALLSAVRMAMEQGVPDEVIREASLDAACPLSNHPLRQSDPERAIDRAIERVSESLGEHGELMMQLNERYATVESYGGKARVFADGPEFDVRSHEEFVKGRPHDFVDVPGGKKPKRVRVHEWWLRDPRHRHYDRVDFLPAMEAPPGVYNLWRGWPYEPKPGDCSLFKAHIRDNICGGNEEHYDYMMNWLVHAVQKPHEPGEVAVVLRGGQGSGKGEMFATLIGELFGARHFVQLYNAKHLTGNFNAHLQSALFVFADEMHGKALDADTLKGFITNKYFFIEPKGCNGFQVKRYARLVMASNHEWTNPTDEDDRRFFVLDVSGARKGDHAYFGKIRHEWDNGGREAFMHELMTRDISGFNHRLRIETAAAVEQKLFTKKGATRAVYNMLVNGEVEAFAQDPLRGVFVSTRELRKWLDLRGDAETELGIELSRASGENAEKHQHRGERRRGYWLPALPEARRRWAEAHKLTVQWPPGRAEWTVREETPEARHTLSRERSDTPAALRASAHDGTGADTDADAGTRGDADAASDAPPIF